MVGGSRRDDGNPVITSSNIFAALEKKRSKKKDSKKEGKKEAKGEEKPSAEALEKLLATPIAVSSWADCDDDEDFGAIGPVPQWGDEAEKEKGDDNKGLLSHDEESEDDIDEHEDEHEEEEHEEEEVAEEKPEPPPRTRVPPVVREPEKQLSKKELKKKELEDLEAVLKEFGIAAPEESATNGSSDAKAKDKDGEDKEEGEPGQESLSKSKSKKKKEKKKEKGEGEKVEEAAGVEPTSGGKEEGDSTGETADENGVVLDPAEVLRRLKAQKSLKSKADEVKAKAKAALEEAAARKAKLAKAKSKDKKHYNQQPVR